MPSRSPTLLPRSLALAVLLMATPALAPWGARAADPLPVVTSNTVIADFVRSVGGNRVDVHPLAPAGTDPHTFQPTPETMKKLARSRVAFFNGSGLEAWWEKTVRSVGRKNLVVVELSKDLTTRSMPGQSHDAEQDPHVWLDPHLAKAYIDRIRDALTRVDAVNGASYADRANAYRLALTELDTWIRAEIAQIPPDRRRIVTFHNAFQYFARRYGLTVTGFVFVSPGKEPSAKALAELKRRIRQERIPAVFAEADFNPKLLESLAQEAGVKVVTNLYDGSLSSGPPADTYLNLMRHNTTQIVDALR